jgi:hypothetical protein
MKCAKLLQYKAVQIVLGGTALAGIFVLGRCLILKPPEPPEEIVFEVTRSEQREEVVEKENPLEKGESVKKEEIRFDEQCRDVMSGTQWSMSFFFLPEDSWHMRIYGEPEGQEVSSFPQVLLTPVQRKKRVQKQEISPSSFVLVKPIQRKKRIASPQKTVQEYVPRIFDEDISYACKGNLVPALLASVADLEARSLLYGVGPLSDCSGIFHRVLMGMKKRCPDHKYPSVKKYRDSRELARWYYEQGKLIRIKNAVAQSDLIRPGMVLFFGRTGVRYRNASVKTLLSPQHGINHVGVVVRMYKDRRGKVTGYELFHGHGRRGRTKASVTKWHKRRPTKASHPPFGNGRQQLVAAARIIQSGKTVSSVEQ